VIPVSVSKFAEMLGGTAIGFEADAMVSSFALDSNQVKPGDLFMAIKGERVDGHDFIPQALASGALGSIAEKQVPPPSIQVPNLVEALARMASLYRDRFDGPVIGITGSAGKTSTKEFVAAALSPLGLVLKTAGNRNTEYTAPLVWSDLEPSHKVAVIEMSMRGFDQIRHLAAFSRPTIGVITNIGFAHMGQVGSRQGIANAKGELLELLSSEHFAVLWREDEFFEALSAKSKAKVASFGFSSDADCHITDYKALSWSSAWVSGTCNGKTWTAEMPAIGRHMALNAAAAVLIASIAGVDPTEAADQIKNAALPPMRMQVIERDGATILLDTYNASPPSMAAAIETLSELPVKGRRLAVIGDMRELGEQTQSAHKEVGRVVAKSGFDEVLFYGCDMGVAASSAIVEGMPCSRVHRGTAIIDVSAFLDKVRPGDAVLIKGSRSLELERALGEVAHS